MRVSIAHRQVLRWLKGTALGNMDFDTTTAIRFVRKLKVTSDLEYSLQLANYIPTQITLKEMKGPKREIAQEEWNTRSLQTGQSRLALGYLEHNHSGAGRNQGNTRSRSMFYLARRSGFQPPHQDGVAFFHRNNGLRCDCPEPPEGKTLKPDPRGRMKKGHGERRKMTADLNWQPIAARGLDREQTPHLRISSAGKCNRAQTYAMLQTPESNPPGAHSRNRMALGHMAEVLIVKELERNGRKLHQMELVSHPERGVFAMMDRDGRMLAPERIAWTNQYVEEILETLAKIVASARTGELPERPYPQSSTECRYCNYHSTCWETDPEETAPEAAAGNKTVTNTLPEVGEAARTWAELKPRRYRHGHHIATPEAPSATLVRNNHPTIPHPVQHPIQGILLVLAQQPLVPRQRLQDILDLADCVGSGARVAFLLHRASVSGQRR